MSIAETEDDLMPLDMAIEASRMEREAEIAKHERRARLALARANSARGLAPGAEIDGAAWRELLLMDKSGQPRPTPGNVLRVLTDDEDFRGCLVRDDFRAKWVWGRRPPGDFPGTFPREMTDADVSYVGAWMERVHGVVPNLQTLGQQLGAVAARHRVDILSDYLRGLKWDGRERLDTWLIACLGVADTTYARAAGRRWLISAAARGLSPGCKADLMLVLEGGQGKRKSSALQVLGGPWHTDSMPTHVDDKDAVMVLSGRWIVEWGELDRFGKQDQSAVKDFVSKRADSIRPPYGRIVEDHPRRCVFAGTTNDDAYLLDATGGRRFLPVRVGDVRLDRLRRNRDQLFAEAVHCYMRHIAASGDEQNADHHRHQWWLTREEEALQVGEVDKRYQVDPWEERLREWAVDLEYTTTLDAFRRLDLDPSRMTQHDSKRLGKALRRLGFAERALVRVGKVREWRFYRTVVTTVTTDQISVVTKKASNIGDVTTVTTVTTEIPHTHTHARAHDKNTCDTGDSGDTLNKSGEICHHRKDSSGDNPNSVVTTPIQQTLDDLWGPT